jgi:hypothetical protein
VGRGNIRANGHPGGGPWRQLSCVACGGHFLETHGTLFHGKRVPPEVIVRVMASLAEGLGIRAAAWVFEVDPNTVLAWLTEAADHLEAFSQALLHDVQVSQVQLDELYAVLSAVKAGQMGVPGASAGKCTVSRITEKFLLMGVPIFISKNKVFEACCGT